MMKPALLLCTGLILLTGRVVAQSAPALSLDQLVGIGLVNSSEIRIAERNLTSARATRRSSSSGLLPSLSAFSLSQDLDPGPSFVDNQGVPIDPPKYGSSYSVGQTLFDGGISWYDRQQGEIGVSRSEVDLERTKEQVILAVHQAYYGYLTRLDLLEVAREALELAQRQMELVEERYRLRAVRQTDLLKGRVNVGQREVALLQADRNLLNAAATLNLSLGLDPASAVYVAPDRAVIPPLMNRDEAQSTALALNTALRNQRLAVENAQLSAKRSRGTFLPTIRVSYGKSANASELKDAFNYDNPRTSLSISLPLWTGFRNSSGYIRARESALAEEERLVAQERNLKGQLVTTLNNLESLHTIIPLNREILESAEADVRLADEQYNLGAISVLDLLNAQVSLISARSTLVRSTYDVLTAQAQLKALMGTIDQ